MTDHQWQISRNMTLCNKVTALDSNTCYCHDNYQSVQSNSDEDYTNYL